MKKLFLFLVFSFLTAGGAYAQSAVATGNVNFRSGPSVKYGVRGTIPAGSAVYVDRCAGNWCAIRYGSRSGWVSKNYLAARNGNYYGRPSYNTAPSVVIGVGRYRRDNWYWNKRHHNRPHNYRPGKPGRPGFHGRPGQHHR